ncbi:MAG: ABC transporter permease [Chloroflexi bacterium]|nr:ABC transporter permease [Chloroflexota bacterium]
MGIAQSIGTAFEAIGANKLRSVLTMLGIIIGVCAVVIIISIGRGASANVTQRLQGLGTNVLTITPGGNQKPGQISAGLGSRQSLTEADAQAIAADIDGLNGVSPSNDLNLQAIFNNTNYASRGQAVYPEYQQIENWTAQAGSLLTDTDEEQSARVCVIGQTVLDNLFGNGNTGSGNAQAAVGANIRLNNVPFVIEGVLASKSDFEDNVIFVPFTTGKRLKSQTFVNDVYVQVADASQMDNVQNQITALLEDRHRINNGQDDFRVRNLNSIVQTAQGVTQTMTLLLSGVAAVSLLVGGIGIMNIMLVSVTERTREIGIRSAIGARARDILSQFLIEAVSLSSAGGIIGILFGVGGSIAVSRVAGWNTVIAPEAVILAFLFAAAVGIFFGYYPARKASQLDPIEALRYE